MQQSSAYISKLEVGTSASTIRTTTLALCYSVAEYAAPVWVRSHHAHILDSELNTACRAITGCLKPTNVEDLYLFAVIAPPDMRCDVCARVEKKKQESNVANSLYESRLKSRSCFLSSIHPADFHPKVIRCNEWQRRLNTKPHSCSANFTESLARGHTSQWTTGRCLSRIRTGITCNKKQRKRWGYYEGDTTCDCGVASENTRHMLECPLLAHSCSLDDLLQFSETVGRTMEDSGLVTRWRRRRRSMKVIVDFAPPPLINRNASYTLTATVSSLSNGPALPFFFGKPAIRTR